MKALTIIGLFCSLTIEVAIAAHAYRQRPFLQ